MDDRRSRRFSGSLAHAILLTLVAAAVTACGDDSPAGADGDATAGAGGSSGSAGGGGDADAAAVEATCLDHLAVLTTIGDDAGCAPSLDAAQCAELSTAPCAAELQAAHACLTPDLTAAACACADEDGDPVLECDFDGLCETERTAYTSCL